MDLSPLSGLLDLIDATRIAELELECPKTGRLVRLRRTPASRRAAPAATATETPAKSTPEAASSTPIEATLVGRFHHPDAPHAVGDPVETDEILGSIESMGLMNVVVSPMDGRLAAVHVEEGQPVEYGQPLFEIDEFSLPD